MNKKLKIEFQHFHGCPNSEKLLSNLKDAIKGLEDKIEFKELIIDNNVLAKKYKFRGSPTLLIDGQDIENMPAPDNPSLTCRFYAKGLPNSSQIRQIIIGKFY